MADRRGDEVVYSNSSLNDDDEAPPKNFVIRTFDETSSSVGSFFWGIGHRISSSYYWFKGDRPGSAAREMEDSESADRRREGINRLMTYDFASGPIYTRRYRQIAQFDTDATVRATAVRAANRARDPKAPPIFVRALSDKSDMVRLEERQGAGASAGPRGGRAAAKPDGRSGGEPRRSYRLCRCAEALSHAAGGASPDREPQRPGIFHCLASPPQPALSDGKRFWVQRRCLACLLHGTGKAVLIGRSCAHSSSISRCSSTRAGRNRPSELAIHFCAYVRPGSARPISKSSKGIWDSMACWVTNLWPTSSPPRIKTWWASASAGKSTSYAADAICASLDSATIVAQRTVLGILNRDGAFAEFVRLPAVNLHVIPSSVDDDAAVFVEPLAAAFQVLKQVKVDSSKWVTVLGDGRLGLLVAQVLNDAGCPVRVIGKHPEKLALCEKWSIRSRAVADIVPRHDQDIVVDCTGSAAGLEMALQMVRPRGVIILKSTVATGKAMNLAPVVIDEVQILGSRCGPFREAIRARRKANRCRHADSSPDEAGARGGGDGARGKAGGVEGAVDGWQRLVGDAIREMHLSALAQRQLSNAPERSSVW